MAEETKTAATTAPASPKFERDDYDPQDVDVNNLPPLPWTRDALGGKLFHSLAIAMGVGDVRQNAKATLDPRSFGMGRANRLIELYGLARPQQLTGNGDGGESDEDFAKRVAQVEALLQEGAAIQETIQGADVPTAGTPRNPKAKPLTPAITKIPASMQNQSAVRRF